MDGMVEIITGCERPRMGEIVALRPLAFYDAVSKRLATDGAAA